ncbi:MAG TPA: triple tyrosine motif-containing protein, partial [Draconibacterium sp.]|nr:triple tyrosine motif-containing protein [Draconibacterium sp.]
ISSIDGIYVYNSVIDSFSISEETGKLFDINGRLKTIENDSVGNIWYISENESGVLRLNEDLTYTKITSPFKQLDGKYVNEFEFIYPYNDENIFLGIDNGFAHYSSKFPKSYTTSFQSFITRVELPYIDSVLNFSNIQSDVLFEFPYKKNSIRFNFTAPFYEELHKMEFSYFLENYSDRWSDWSAESFKDFTNLHEGDYTFQLKAKNVYNTESELSSFKFTIKPPWYRSNFAYYGYFIALCILVFLVVKFVLYRMKRMKELEIRKHKKELKKKEELFRQKEILAEKEIIRLRNETLQNDVIHRNKELTNQTINIVQKNKFLIRLNEELHRIQSSTDDATAKTKIILIKKRILKEIDDKKQNRIFETYFDEVHEEFFKRMKEKYPELSPKDLRLCAFIRMNISSKEISSLLNISYRGVEINRYRLRKKLDLSREVNLPTFLSNI